MSEEKWAKAVVTIKDVEGTTHHIVGYKMPLSQTVTNYPAHSSTIALDAPMWDISYKNVEVRDVRELPTGWGAIVRVTIEDEDWHGKPTKNTVLLTRLGDVWVDDEGEYDLMDGSLRDATYVTGLEVLFEGVAK